MSLIRPYEELWDMSLGGSSKENEISHWWGNLSYAVVAAVFKVCFRYHADGIENLRGFKDKSGVVVVANHTSFLDVAFLWLTVRTPQWMRFMARDSLFDNAGGLAGQLISRYGAFPVTRDSADRTAIKRAARMLKNNEIVGILPEGTRRGKGSKTPEIHAGAALIAKMGDAPILPATVRNAENVKRKGERLRFPKITVEYGKPILLSDFDFLPRNDRLEGCSWYAMRECFALSQRVPREQVDMKALFPDGRDFTEVFAEHPIPEHTTEEVVAMKEEAARKKEAAPKAKGDADTGSGEAAAGSGEAATKGEEDVR